MALSFEYLTDERYHSTRKEFTGAVTDIITSASHGMQTGDIIKMYISVGASAGHLPTPLVVGKAYYVKYINSNTYYLALTDGGATINITDTGSTPGYKFSWYRSADYKMFTAAVSNIITCTGHGLAEGEIVRVDSNATLPAPLVEGTDYYVKYINANTFYLALTLGGDSIDITTTGTGSHWWQRKEGFLIKYGSLVTNLTRAGSAMLIDVARLNLGIGDLVAVRLLILSGSFLLNDECSTPDGGFFSLTNNTASDPVNSILVNGIDDTDTTATLDGDVDAVTQDIIYTTGGGALLPLRYIRIDNEWMFILVSIGSNRVTVKRGMFGTTPASHTTGTAIWYLEEDFPKKLVDKDIAEGWGFCAMDAGKFTCSCFLYMGRPDQASQTIILTQLDRFHIERWSLAGGVVYDTIVQSGVGWVESGVGNYQGFYFNGANISTSGMKHFENATLNLFGGTLFLSNNESFNTYGQMNVMASAINSLLSDISMTFLNRDNCKIYKSWINNMQVAASSNQLDWNGVLINMKILADAFLFAYTAGNATLKNIEVVDPTYNRGIYCSNAEGTKTFIDCDIIEDTVEDSSTVMTIFKKTVNINCITQDNTPLQDVNVKIFDKNMVEVADANTDINGNIVEQEITYKYLDTDYSTMIDLNPFTFFISKPGWKEKNFTYNITAPIQWAMTMYDYELDDDIKYR